MKEEREKRKMKCYKCRAEVPEGGKFCFQCGAEQGFSEELIKRAIDGEQEAITELYNRTYNNAYYTVKALIKDEDTALDIIQDSYVKAFKSLNQLQEADKFRAWIKRICHNRAVDYLRKKKPVMFSAISADEERAVEFEDDRVENLPEEMMDQKETGRLIREILNSLSEEQRLVVGMFYYEQLSVREIAQTLGVSENTVKSRLNYARKKIEEKVIRLEKEQGIRLHSLAPIPFLLWLFKSQDIWAAEIPSQEILLALQEECVRYSKAAKAVKTGSKVAKTAAKTAGKGLATKILAAVAAVAVLGGGAAIAYKAVNQNQPMELPAEREAAETEPVTTEPAEEPEKNRGVIMDEIYSCMGLEHYALVDGDLLHLVVTGDGEKFGYILGNLSEEITVLEEDYEIDENTIRVKNAEVVHIDDKLLFTGEGLNGEKFENVPFYIKGSEEAKRLFNEFAEMNEEIPAVTVSDFAGYYKSPDTSLGITIQVIDDTTADITLENISSNGANAFHQEKQAYLDGDSLIMDMETSEGDTITFTLDDTSLIVNASEHYQARANTYISGTYLPASESQNGGSVNLDAYVGEYANGQDWNTGILNIEKRDEKYLYVQLQGSKNRGDQELSTVFEGVAEPENITDEGITINIYGEDVNLIKTDFGFKLSVPQSLRNQLGFDSYLYDNEYLSTAPQ